MGKQTSPLKTQDTSVLKTITVSTTKTSLLPRSLKPVTSDVEHLDTKARETGNVLAEENTFPDKFNFDGLHVIPFTMPTEITTSEGNLTDTSEEYIKENKFKAFTKFYFHLKHDLTQLKRCSAFSSSGKQNINIITKCLSSYKGSNEIVSRCETTYPDYSHFKPVLILDYGIFQNKDCVICHGLPLTNYIPFQAKFACHNSSMIQRLKQVALKTKNTSALKKALYEMCSFSIEPADESASIVATVNYYFKRFKCDYTVINDNCHKKPTAFNFMCNSFRAPISVEVKLNITLTRFIINEQKYTNMFCSTCDGHTPEDTICIVHEKKGVIDEFFLPLPDYSLLFDINQDSTALAEYVGNNGETKCLEGYFNVLLDKCQLFPYRVQKLTSKLIYSPKFVQAFTFTAFIYQDISEDMLQLQLNALKNVLLSQVTKDIEMKVQTASCSDVMPIWMESVAFNKNSQIRSVGICLNVIFPSQHTFSTTFLTDTQNILTTTRSLFSIYSSIQEIYLVNTNTSMTNLKCPDEDTLLSVETSIFEINGRNQLFLNIEDKHYFWQMTDFVLLARLYKNGLQIKVDLTTWICKAKTKMNYYGVVSVVCNSISIFCLFLTIMTLLWDKKTSGKLYGALVHLSAALLFSQLIFQVSFNWFLLFSLTMYSLPWF